eukprot:5337151-Ditylum_brightwellii.AAC.1
MKAEATPVAESGGGLSLILMKAAATPVADVSGALLLLRAGEISGSIFILLADCLIDDSDLTLEEATEPAERGECTGLAIGC